MCSEGKSSQHLRLCTAIICGVYKYNIRIFIYIIYIYIYMRDLLGGDDDDFDQNLSTP